MRLTYSICLGMLTAFAASASVIGPSIVAVSPSVSNFSAGPSAGTPFTETINTSGTSGTVVSITNSSISCASATCSGNSADFSGTINNISTPSPFGITIDGSLSGANSVTGNISLTLSPQLLAANTTTNYAFTIPAGEFSARIATAVIPSNFGSSLNFYGTVSFSGLTNGQTISLPSSLSFSLAPTPVPEPGTWGLMLVSLGVFAFTRLRASNQ